MTSRFRRHVTDPLQYWYIKKFRRNFGVDGRIYAYNSSQYNFSWANERSVEIPFFTQILASQKKEARILEVGNVLSHYQPIFHEVVDKYEKAEGVINQDIVDFKPNGTYDCILSISTLEHVGWDEAKKDNQKYLKAIKNIQRILKPNGQFYFSIPLGYNPHVDAWVKENKQSIWNKVFLKRISHFGNMWTQISWPENQDFVYAKPFPHANVIMVGEMGKKS